MNVAELTYEEVCERVTVLPFGDRYSVDVDCPSCETHQIGVHVVNEHATIIGVCHVRAFTLDQEAQVKEAAVALVKRYVDECDPTDAQIAAQYDAPSANEMHEESRQQQARLKR